MGLFRDVTPEQHARRQAIIAFVLLVGIPILNALLQKYGIPPIVLPASSSQQQTATKPTSMIDDVEHEWSWFPCTEQHETMPLNLDTGPVRRFIAARKDHKHHLFQRIKEHRGKSKTAETPQPTPRPAVEAPVKPVKGPCPWCVYPPQ